MSWLKGKWLPPLPRESKSNSPEFKSAELANVATAFWLLLAGWTLSLGIFALEWAQKAVRSASAGVETKDELGPADGFKSCGDNRCACRLHLLETSDTS